MSDLLSLLALGSAGIAAQNSGVAVATNNVANANTEGYSRQRVDLESLLAGPNLGAGVGGVRAGRPDRMSDDLLGGRLRSSAGALAMSQAYYDAVRDAEQRLASGPKVHEQLGELFGQLGRVAASPTDSVQRTAVIAAARDLVEGIHRRAAEVAAARQEVNQRIRDRAAQVSELAAKLAETNLAIARSSDPALRDERDRTAVELAQLVGGSARLDGNGQFRFVLDGGGVLVDGRHAAQLDSSIDPVTGDAMLELVTGSLRRDVGSSITGGKIAADFATRDTVLTGARDDLDQLAFDIASGFNAAHSANAGLDGVSGRLMFAAPTGVTGAAAALTLDSALIADPTRLATAAPGSGPGDNRGALALHAVVDARISARGDTLGNAAIDMVARIGSEARRAGQTSARDELVADHLAGLRDSLSGVDVQEELTNLARFEHASSAMTRFVSTIDNLLGELIDRV